MAAGIGLERTAVELTRALIRIDTANRPGGPGEQEAARLVAATLVAAGGTPQVLTGSPRRDNVVLRIPGRSAGPGTLVHSHLDTVPPDVGRWQVDPWSGQVRDGCIWGVGAVDMKSAAAAAVAVARAWLLSGHRPEHDVVFAWLADEEAGGHWGAKYLAEHRADLFAGCDTAIGEVGGFAVPLGRLGTLYPVMTAERGHAVLELSATTVSGHSGAAGAARPNAVTELAAAVAAIGRHRFPRHPTTAAGEFYARLAAVFGLPAALAPTAIGPLAALVEPGLRGTAVPTVFRAGETPNVSPATAAATVDCRFVPGHEAEFLADLADLVPGGITAAVTVLSPGADGAFSGRVAATITAALRRADPAAIVVPYGVAASTDGPAFAALGLRPLGFTPLGLPAGFPFGELFHGVDERVPVAAVEFGVRVLADVLDRL